MKDVSSRHIWYSIWYKNLYTYLCLNSANSQSFSRRIMLELIRYFYLLKNLFWWHFHFCFRYECHNSAHQHLRRRYSMHTSCYSFFYHHHKSCYSCLLYHHHHHIKLKKCTISHGVLRVRNSAKLPSPHANPNCIGLKYIKLRMVRVRCTRRDSREPPPPAC